MLVGDISANNARRYPAKRALVDGDRVLTWSQVEVDPRQDRCAAEALAHAAAGNEGRWLVRRVVRTLVGRRRQEGAARPLG
mgnify:CR=1 FL=1